MYALFLPLVKKQGEFFLTDNLGHCAYGPEIAGGQRSKGVDIMLVLPIVQARDDIPRHVNEEYTMHPNIDEICL